MLFKKKKTPLKQWITNECLTVFKDKTINGSIEHVVWNTINLWNKKLHPVACYFTTSIIKKWNKKEVPLIRLLLIESVGTGR